MNQQIKDSFEILSLIRKKFLNMTETLSLEELNKIPSGFNNNLIWNIIHGMVSTDILVYAPCGMDIPLSKWVDSYRKDTKPDPNLPVTTEMFSQVKQELMTSYERLMRDYQNQVFKSYKPYQTQFGVTLSNVEYSILYAIDHEMLHLGYAMALRRVVKS